MRKHLCCLLGTAFLALCLAFSAAAGEKATKEECEAKVKEVAAIIRMKGLEKGINAIKEAGGPFVWKDSYVFLSDDKGVILAHPVKPKLETQNLLGLRDVNGKRFVAEYVNVANSKGEGWVEYMWPVQGSRTPGHKMAFVYKVPGTNILAVAEIME